MSRVANEVDKNLLFAAAEAGIVETVAMLLNKDIYTMSDESEAFRIAYQYKNKELVKFLSDRSISCEIEMYQIEDRCKQYFGFTID